MTGYQIPDLLDHFGIGPEVYKQQLEHLQASDENFKVSSRYKLNFNWFFECQPEVPRNGN